MITPAFSPTATERVLPRLALDFTTASLDARVTVTRALNTATRTNSSGALEIVNANLPRFDYDPSTLACKGLLIEEVRTNLLLNSLINGSNLSTQSVTLSATAHTISFYGTGSIVISGGHSATIAGTGAYPSRRTYTFTPTAGSSTFTVSGTVQYAQLEAGAFATSYIPTTATSVTRNADVVQMTGTNFSSWFNGSEGAFMAQWLQGPVSTTKVGGVLECVGSVRSPQTTSGVVFYGQNGGSVLLGASTANALYKVAYAYKTGTVERVAINGGATASNSVNYSTVPTLLTIGHLASATNFWVNSWVQKLYYWPQSLTSPEVQAFSK